ncbi:MAG TPA: branched-chain amino acid ABC transporter permease [Bellilinea sp.]|nr:branched-chain amino acid ABC transporter permease [Bellilinea sp.]
MSILKQGLLRSSKFWYPVLGVFLILFAFYPFLGSGYWIRVLTGVFMYAALATSLNVIIGYTGYTDFGNVVFFGIGAYTTAVLMQSFHTPLVLATLAGGVVSAIWAGLLGLPILRLKGHYFAIATIGVMDALREIVTNMNITGGGMGISIPAGIDVSPEQFNNMIYYIMLLLMIIYVIASALIRKSRFGYGLRAIRADEQAAAIAGIPTVRYKVTAWAISAFMTGLVGGFFAYWYAYIEPQDVFNIDISVKYMIMMLIGGSGTVFGPVVGAFFLEIVSELVWGRFFEYHLGILGLIIIFAVIFLPKGILPLIQRRISFKAWLAEFKQSAG